MDGYFAVELGMKLGDWNWNWVDKERRESLCATLPGFLEGMACGLTGSDCWICGLGKSKGLVEGG